MIDDDELLRVEQVMRDDQRTDRVIGCDTARIADHVGIPRPETKTMLEQNARVHAGEHSGVAARADLKITQVETAREDFVGS